MRRVGEDFAVGTPVVPRGTLLEPGALVAVAAADVGAVSAWRRPRVRLLAAGDEIVAPGNAVATRHAIPDSLSIALAAFARGWGAEMVASARVADDPAAIRAAARAALVDVDVLVIAGGASRGDRDHCRAALAALGLEIAFADIAIKPGKPVWFGRLGSLAVLGIPGNPTAALTVARLFLAPLLAGLGGRPPDAALDWEQRPLVAPIPSQRDREGFCARPGWMAASGCSIVRRLRDRECSHRLVIYCAARLMRRLQLRGTRSPCWRSSMRLLGAIIAGGTSRRFGSDKAMAQIAGRSLLDHARAALVQEVDDLVLCGRTVGGTALHFRSARTGSGAAGRDCRRAGGCAGARLRRGGDGAN
ncbi:NTP transferase domain-containing protein [Sphingomonas sp. J344]|uniref:molybdopterin-binding protein n=1 Tax=Sphingomonas sp. J344 TaxID=2898434 RepID=UPI00215104AF|nr:molybdopterin-binding protein [Sphingomonas sp. J344]MCR5872033.1 NTP transferase domain-containing protein [Sphingomonas sp. J344]